MIKTHYQEVRSLSVKMILNCLAMLKEAQKLEKEWEILKKTFCDDGIEEVDKSVSEILDKISQSQTDMTTLAKILTSYADDLEASK